MKRSTVFLAFGLTCGCGVSSTELTIEGVLFPMSMGGTCSFPIAGPAAATLAGPMVFDTARSLSTHMPLNVENRLDNLNHDLTSGKPDPSVVNNVNTVSPLRMDIRWECDSIGFRADLGPLVVPAFDFVKPFCLDKRSQTTSTFVGLDVIPASGDTIPPGDNWGMVDITPIPYELGQALDELFTVAAYADDCCRNSQDCSGTGQAGCGMAGPGVQCAAGCSCCLVDKLFATLDKNQMQRTPFSQGTPQNKDLVRFAPFAEFNGDYWVKNVETANGGTPREVGDEYQMRMRGVLEGVISDGTLVSSDQFAWEFDLCKQCGAYDAMTHTRLAHPASNDCYVY
jgi:hypothetical protein